MLLVIPPGLPLELPSGQILLMRARHVVEGKKERLCVQLLEQGGVVQYRQLDLGVGGGDPHGGEPHADRVVRPVGVYRLGH